MGGRAMDYAASAARKMETRACGVVGSFALLLVLDQQATNSAYFGEARLSRMVENDAFFKASKQRWLGVGWRIGLDWIDTLPFYYCAWWLVPFPTRPFLAQQTLQSGKSAPPACACLGSLTYLEEGFFF